VVIFRGYLHQNSNEEESLGLFTSDWELKYFTLGSGGLLRVYESDRDEGKEQGGLLNLAVSCGGGGWAGGIELGQRSFGLVL
jgi:hypothetical protein